MGTNIKCVHCQAQNYTKHGSRMTQNRGKIQRYKCSECKRFFTNDEGFYRMRNSPQKITAGIDLYFSNLSSRKVRNHFRRHWEHNASHVTVLDWCRRYTLKVQKYIDTLEPKLSGKVYADETEIDRKKHKDVFWCAVDWETRYICGTHYSLTRHKEEAIHFIKKTISNKRPVFIQTDAYPLYPNAIRRATYSHRKLPPVKHIANNFSKTGVHNVRIETVFMKIKDRVDDFRGLKALWSAPILMAGIVIQHNFIEEHTTTRRLPSELAGMKLETGENRWLGLIKMATNKQ